VSVIIEKKEELMFSTLQYRFVSLLPRGENNFTKTVHYNKLLVCPVTIVVVVIAMLLPPYNYLPTMLNALFDLRRCCHCRRCTEMAITYMEDMLGNTPYEWQKEG
jgi:hypothetical protein